MYESRLSIRKSLQLSLFPLSPRQPLSICLNLSFFSRSQLASTSRRMEHDTPATAPAERRASPLSEAEQEAPANAGKANRLLALCPRVSRSQLTFASSSCSYSRTNEEESRCCHGTYYSSRKSLSCSSCVIFQQQLTACLSMLLRPTGRGRRVQGDWRTYTTGQEGVSRLTGKQSSAGCREQTVRWEGEGRACR